MYEHLRVILQGSLGATERDRVALAVEQALLHMEKIAGMDLLLEDGPNELKAIVKALRADLGSVMQDDGPKNSPLTRLPAEKRATYEHLFELIYECSTNRKAAKALVDRILLKIYL
jgi:hypothetical protein